MNPLLVKAQLLLLGWCLVIGLQVLVEGLARARQKPAGILLTPSALMARRIRSLAILALVAGALTWSSSFVLPGQGQVSSQGRREALLGLAGAVGVGLASEPAQAFEGAGQWMGYYADPQHPMCPRKIVYEYDLYEKAQMMVDGGDGNPGCEKKVLTRWTAKVDWKAGSDEITIDFSKKGGPSGVVGKWDTDGIVFPDGNKWKKIISYSTGNGQGV